MSSNRTSPELLLQLYADAVAAKDQTAFVSLYSEDVVVFDAWGVWEYRGRAEWSRMVTDWFRSLGSENVEATFADVDVVTSDSLATIQAIVTYSAKTASGEKLRALDNRLSWVLQKNQSGWQVRHEHSSAPADFESGKVLHTRRPA